MQGGLLSMEEGEIASFKKEGSIRRGRERGEER